MQRLLARIVQNLPMSGQQAVLSAHAFSVEHLASLSRRSGESYAHHGHEVAATLREMSDDAGLLAVAILHDLPVHHDGEELLQKSPLSSDQQQLLKGMHTLRRLHIDAETKDLDTVLEAFVSDPRLLPLRMAHRLNDVRSIHRFPKTLQRQIGRETLHMYGAIAGRLGMHAWRHEMEDLCFHIIQHDAARALQKQFELHHQNDQRCLELARALVLEAMEKQGIVASIDSRTKSLYSTYRKMVVKKRRFDELTDRLALRIIVNSQDDCYRALGIVHQCLHPIPGKLKDYIGAPKENGYRSIHTVVYPLAGITEYPMEIQIRTAEMHRECQYGALHHADYKHELYAFRSQNARVDLFKNLLVLRENNQTVGQFARTLRNYFSENHIAVFDAENNLYHLHAPATALDFACHVLGKRSRYLKFLRINGRMAPLDAVLKDGDTVECTMGRPITVREEWIRACKQVVSKKLLKKMLETSPATSL